MHNLPTPIFELPIEVVAAILGWLPNFSTLLDTVRTCKPLHDAYDRYSRTIILAIFSRECEGVEDLLWELEFAIRHAFVKRDDAQAVLDRAWPFFKNSQWEELLLPSAKRLAKTYCNDKRPADAITLLRKIWDGTQLFNPFPGELKRLPTLIPLGRMLAELIEDCQEREQILSDIESLNNRGPGARCARIAEIRRKGITLSFVGTVWDVSGKTGKELILQPGMYYIGNSPNDHLALATVYNYPRMQCEPRPTIDPPWAHIQLRGRKVKKGRGAMVNKPPLRMQGNKRAEAPRSVANPMAELDTLFSAIWEHIEGQPRMLAN